MNFIFEVHLRRTTNPLGSRSNPDGFEDRTPLGSISNPDGFEDRTPLGSCLRTQKGSCLRTLLGSISNPEGFEERRTLWVRDRTQRVRRSNPSGFDLEPRRVRRSNPEGFEDRTLLGSCLRTQKGSCLRTLLGSISNPEGFEDRTLLGSRSNPEGSIFEPSGFHEPRGFVLRTQRVRDRTLWVPRTQKGSKIEPSWVSNPSGFVEPRGFEDRTLWVRSRTQKGSKIRTLLASWNPEGSKIEPSGFDLEPRRVRRHEPFWVRRHEPRRVRSSNPSGFEIEPEGFDLRTLWVRSRTQRVRRSSKMNFEDEVHLRRTKMKFIFEERR
ncbi:hypothetical protein ACOSQ3_031905 [Xanthoceras sorbifolium]